MLPPAMQEIGHEEARTEVSQRRLERYRERRKLAKKQK